MGVLAGALHNTIVGGGVSPDGQPYAVQASDAFPRQKSGQLSSQGLRVINLFVNPTSNQVVVAPFFQPLQAVGRRILWDPTGEAYIAGLEIAFEHLANAEYISIYPGVTYAFDDGYQFDKLYLRFQSLYITSIGGLPSGGVFIGRLIISNGMYASLAGSTPDIPVYTRTTPHILSIGTSVNGAAGMLNPWVVTGGTSYLTYEFAVPGVTAAAYTTGYSTKIKNIGSTPVYASLNGALTTPGATSFSQLYVINPGEEWTAFAAPRPNNAQNVGTSAPQPVYIYSGDAAAAVSWYLELIQ